MDRLGRNLGGHIPSCPRHVRRDAVSMATAAAYQRRIEHSAVMGVWRPKVLTNFDEIWYNSMLGPKRQSHDQILKVKIQNGGRSLLESIRNVITRLQMDRLGRIPSCSQYWKCYNSSYDGTDWYDSWVVASMEHLCCKTVSLVYGRYCYPTVNVLVLWGV